MYLDSFEADVLLAFAEDVIAALFVGTAVFIYLALGRTCFEQRLCVVLHQKSHRDGWAISCVDDFWHDRFGAHEVATKLPSKTTEFLPSAVLFGGALSDANSVQSSAFRHVERRERTFVRDVRVQRLPLRPRLCRRAETRLI